MKSIKTSYLFVLSFIFLIGCQLKPRPINYGLDACKFCTMTIVDKVHAAQVVTSKGKVYSFDAIECMINYLHRMNEDEIGLYLTNELNTPEKLLDATTATYLKCQAIPSPMGAYLSAFESLEDAQNTLDEHGGQLFTWKEIINYFKENDM